MALSIYMPAIAMPIRDAYTQTATVNLSPDAEFDISPGKKHSFTK